MKNKKIKSDFLKNSVSSVIIFFSHKRKFLLLTSFLFILLLTLFFRLYQLEQTPPGLSEGEANLGLLALDPSNKNSTTTLSSLNKPDFGFFTSLILVGFKVFGVNIFALRILSALIGTLTVFGFFLLLRKLHYSLGMSLLGTFFMSFSFWHINLSRLACTEIFIPFIIIWFLFFLLSGVFSKKYLYFILSGATIALGVSMHPLIIFSLLIPFLFISLTTLLDKKFLIKLKGQLFIFALSILFFSIPLLFQFINNPAIFLNSFKQALLFDASNLSLATFIKNALTYFLSLFYLGDPNQLHNQSSLPAIPLAWSVLFLFGFFLSAKIILSSLYGKSEKSSTPKNIHASILAQCIFFVAILIASLYSNHAPDFKKFAWAIPAVFIFCTIPFEHLLGVYQKLKQSIRISMKKWRWNIMQFSMLILFLAIVLAGFSQISLYFQIWAKDIRTVEAFQQSQVELGKIIKSLIAKENNFIILPEDTTLSKNGAIENFKTFEFAGFPEIKNYTLVLPSEDLLEINCENSLFVFYNSTDLLRKQFQKKCPSNNFQRKMSPDGKRDFWTMQE